MRSCTCIMAAGRRRCMGGCRCRREARSADAVDVLAPGRSWPQAEKGDISRDIGTTARMARCHPANSPREMPRNPCPDEAFPAG
jgi:hypothetical protein